MFLSTCIVTEQDPVDLDRGLQFIWDQFILKSFFILASALFIGFGV